MHLGSGTWLSRLRFFAKMQVSVSVLVDKVDERALRAMKRRNLQQVAKKVGVRANSTNELIITNILSALGGGSPHITNPLANPQPRETRSRSPSTSESDTGKLFQGKLAMPLVEGQASARQTDQLLSTTARGV